MRAPERDALLALARRAGHRGRCPSPGIPGEPLSGDCGWPRVRAFVPVGEALFRPSSSKRWRWVHPVVATDCTSGPREVLQAGALGALVPVREIRIPWQMRWLERSSGIDCRRTAHARTSSTSWWPPIPPPAVSPRDRRASGQRRHDTERGGARLRRRRKRAAVRVRVLTLADERHHAAPIRGRRPAPTGSPGGTTSLWSVVDDVRQGADTCDDGRNPSCERWGAHADALAGVGKHRNPRSAKRCVSFCRFREIALAQPDARVTCEDFSLGTAADDPQDTCGVPLTQQAHRFHQNPGALYGSKRPKSSTTGASGRGRGAVATRAPCGMTTTGDRPCSRPSSPTSSAPWTTIADGPRLHAFAIERRKMDLCWAPGCETGSWIVNTRGNP